MSEGEKGSVIRVLNAEFLSAASSEDTLPPVRHPEIVFAGRSNSGKSTLLNALSERKSLARTGKTPGRTQTINYFLLRVREEFQATGESGEEREVYFVDLPGYGHAEVSKAMKRQWSELLSSYLQTRSSIAAITVLSDCRRAVSEEEAWFFTLSQSADVILALTKCDKIGTGTYSKVRAAAADSLGIDRSQVLMTGAGGKKKYGVAPLRERLLRPLFLDAE